MHKNALFLLKNCKNRPALGADPYIRRLEAPTKTFSQYRNPGYATTTIPATYLFKKKLDIGEHSFDFICLN